MKEYYGGCVPRKDDRDFLAEHILGGPAGDIPERFVMLTKANDQSARKETAVACTCFSTYNVATILNEIEHQKQIEQLPVDGWELQKKFGTHSTRGDSLHTAFKSIIQNALKTKDGDYPVKAYAKIDNKDIKYWLSQGYPIITYGPVAGGNFTQAKAGKMYKPKPNAKIQTYHAFAIVGYDNDVMILLNSYGPSWGKFGDGTFRMKEEDLTGLGAKYILYDVSDVKLIFRDVAEKSPHAEGIIYCLQNNIMVGEGADQEPDPLKRLFKPNQAVTRGELATIIKRLSMK